MRGETGGDEMPCSGAENRSDTSRGGVKPRDGAEQCDLS